MVAYIRRLSPVAANNSWQQSTLSFPLFIALAFNVLNVAGSTLHWNIFLSCSVSWNPLREPRYASDPTSRWYQTTLMAWVVTTTHKRFIQRCELLLVIYYDIDKSSVVVTIYSTFGESAGTLTAETLALQWLILPLLARVFEHHY